MLALKLRLNIHHIRGPWEAGIRMHTSGTSVHTHISLTNKEAPASHASETYKPYCNLSTLKNIILQIFGSKQ